MERLIPATVKPLARGFTSTLVEVASAEVESNKSQGSDVDDVIPLVLSNTYQEPALVTFLKITNLAPLEKPQSISMSEPVPV